MAALGWQRANESLKKPFYDAYKEDRERYAIMINAYEACLTSQQKDLIRQNESDRFAIMKESRLKKVDIRCRFFNFIRFLISFTSFLADER